MTTTSTVEQCREQLVQICAALPEVSISGEQHLAFQVRKKTFAYYLNNHHGDGRIALCCKAYPGDLEALIAFDPLRFYMPAYLGPKGWVGLRLDLADVDWEQVAERSGSRIAWLRQSAWQSRSHTSRQRSGTQERERLYMRSRAYGERWPAIL